MPKKFYRINQYITASTVRVIDEKGKQVGVMPKEEALNEARKKKLDLIEIAPQAQPPVCKLITFEKFKFLENKKRQESKRKSKKVELKEVRLTPFIAQNDFDFRIKRAKKFLKEGNKVKVSVRFKGRQMTKKSFGYELLKKATEQLSSFSEIDFESKFSGRQLEIVLKPVGEKHGQQKQKEKTQDKKVNPKKD